MDPNVLDKEFRKKNDDHRGQTQILTAYFLDIREKFKPVMRHYFTERHKNPISWFTMRLNYARSVATTSIVGHVLGLGDRHISNILMDNITGEVIHIDLGIAFEQVRPLCCF
jgi:serine-protein kinase ATM